VGYTGLEEAILVWNIREIGLIRNTYSAATILHPHGILLLINA